MMEYYRDQKPTKQSKGINTNVVLYLGELPPDVDQFELHEFIMSQGKFNVESLIVKPTKENKSYAYVKFKTKGDVDKAQKVLHLKSLRNYVIKAEYFKQGNKNRNYEGDENSNLFVKNLPASMSPKDMYELFSKYGNINSIKLKQNKLGECIGYGYVNFDNSSDAENALKNLNNFQFNGKILHVSHFSPKQERSDEEKFPLVLIKVLPPSITTEKDLEDTFSRFGQISFCGLVNGNITNNQNSKDEKENQQGKIGVVLFANRGDASSAVESLNETILDDSKVPIQLSLAPINKETIDKLWKAKQEAYKSKYEGCNLVIKNIPKEITERNLFEICKQFGDLAGARIATEGIMKEIKNENGFVLDKEFVYESKGYGYVLYRNSNDARLAKETLNNRQIQYKNLTLCLIVEYYDYSKADKSHQNQFSNNKNPKQKKTINKKNNNSMEGHMNTRQNRFDQNMNPNFGEENQQSIMINNRQIINPKMPMGNMMGNPNSGRGTNTNLNNNRFNNEMTGNMNPNINPNMNSNMNQNMNPYMNPQNQGNMNPMQMGMNMGYNMNMQQNVSKSADNQFIIDIKRILQIQDREERTELLGETIFYFLMQFIPNFKLNNSNGKLDDPTICSKLTGMLLSIEPKDLLEICGNQDYLKITIKDVVNQLLTKR